MLQNSQVDITLTEKEILEIIRLLDFTRMASNIALTNENLSTSDIEILETNVANAVDISNNFIASLKIGNVDKDKVH